MDHLMDHLQVLRLFATVRSRMVFATDEFSGFRGH